MIRVDLSRELRSAELEAERVLSSKTIPWIVDRLANKWPRDTGYSAAHWTAEPNGVSNSAPYSEFIRAEGGLALDTVLHPILTQAADAQWTE